MVFVYYVPYQLVGSTRCNCKPVSVNRKWHMGIAEEFAEAWFNTSVHRRRREQLLVTATTELPYVLLSPAEINKQETSVRRGTLSVEKPQIIVPGQNQRIADFTKLDDEKFEDIRNSLILARFVKFPSGRYLHQSYQLDIVDTPIETLTESWNQKLEQQQDQTTGLITTRVPSWRLALLVYVAQTVGKSMHKDLDALLEKILGVSFQSDPSSFPPRGGPRDSEFYLS
ncbi:hypothetical protein Gasu2_10930 [Galdieria sulphuraria]|uniref:Uncharacterized protein n=1 Tax=Galdieria sulphuraria TaxID=130081 RepID=M2W875_GALSU|nr:uncharacterized protein Gasu_08150 [Galdieria sulphuraria]EME32071.1 hypothetical protein Gasu_08150 [Galdieria sulphuraria]GJD06691.1 hypothetical protein Gasu2_10930 [Galdieria sulphuraria]|eukprot:XP_005708591.1 hypothetical protein Gasu_08150 [Galdieria sulphuraria]